MSFYLDKKYVNLLSSRLEKFRWENDSVANFRCIICGDSKKNKYKRRGYLFEVDDGMIYKCHNCGASLPFGKVLKDFDQDLYKQYIFEKFGDTNKKTKEKQQDTPEPKKYFDIKNVLPISELPSTHEAYRYCVKRKLPIEYLNKLFYTDNYKKWINENVIADKFGNVPKSDPRIIIPFLNNAGKPFAFQGRTLLKDPDIERYLSVKVDGNLLIYGLDTIDLSETIYLFEGPFDSMFKKNSLAAAGSSLKKLIKSEHDIVFCFDNEPRSKEICGLMKQLINAGRKVLIWPTSISDKDINNLVLSKNGIDIDQFVRDNVYSGLDARIKFGKWRKT
jgi:hypothetical protein